MICELCGDRPAEGTLEDVDDASGYRGTIEACRDCAERKAAR